MVIPNGSKSSRFTLFCWLICLCAVAAAATAAVSGAWLPAAQGQAAAPSPIDPQKVQDQDDMTWDDYRPIPGHNWADPSLKAERGFKIALVAIDFSDQPFVITLPGHSDPFGNPQIDPVPREQVPQFYADFFMKPGAVNHGQTINGYWMGQGN